MEARGATQAEMDAVKEEQRASESEEVQQEKLDEYMTLDPELRAFVEGRWSPADAVDAAIEGVGEELVGEYGGDTSSLLEGVIGDTPPPATEAGATEEETTTEPTLTEADIAYNQTRRIDIEAQARREGLLDSTALGIPATQPKRKGLLDDRLAIAQALAQLSAGVAQGGLFGDITDTGEVRGGLVNVMPGAIKTLRDAQTATTGEDIPDSNWGYGPAEEEQLFYIGPGGEITWVKDNEGNYVLKGTTKGNELANGEKAKMGQALIHMGVPAAMLLTDYYATAFNEEGKMVVDGEPVEGIARWLQSAKAVLKSQGNIEGANDLERKYQSAKHATGTLGEVFLRLTTGAAYNQQEYGNAMELFWIKVNDNPESVKHKRKMLSQFGPMLEMMSGMDPGGEAYDSAIKNLKELRQMKAQLLEGARQGYYGEWTPEQLRAMELDVLTDDPTISQPELYENRKFGGEGT
jgi:hypothetical protein